MLPLWSNLSNSTSSCFSGITSCSTCTLFASFQLGIAGNASSFSGFAWASNLANWGASDLVAGAGLKVGAGAGLNVGAACDLYCWFNGRESIEAAGAGGAAEYAELSYGLGGGDLTRSWPFLLPDGQQQVQHLKQQQANSAPQHTQRATQRTTDRTMRPPTMMATMTGHLSNVSHRDDSY